MNERVLIVDGRDTDVNIFDGNPKNRRTLHYLCCTYCVIMGHVSILYECFFMLLLCVRFGVRVWCVVCVCTWFSMKALTLCSMPSQVNS